MRFTVLGIILFGTALAAAPAAAQNPPPTPAVARTMVASAKLAGLGTSPLFFRALAVTIPAGQTSEISAPDGILYQLSGSTEVSAAGRTKTIGPGEAAFIASGAASLKAGNGGPSSALHFLLAPAASLDQPVENAPAAVKELYRTAAPIPGLKPGGYELNLTRITFPPRMPSNPPHHRSGAALYNILSGSGANTVAGETVERGAGSWVYEPSSLVHQWGNPGNEPLTFLAFNINPEGVAAVLPGSPK
jgi:quercetin dioxygenase-like cupin family protein